jgi:hypothetical protein
VRLAIACAMLLAFFGPSASASDERGPRANSAGTTSPDSAAPVPGPAVTSDSSAPAAASSSLTASGAVALNAPPPSGEFDVAPMPTLLAPPAAFIKLKQQPRTHSFFDSRNTFGLASLGASLTADALSTQKGLAYPGFHEMNPIARPFVQTRLGTAAYNAGSFGLMAGLMYWAHKKEHHRLERILPLAVGGWEGLLSARNYRVIANRAK